MRSQIATSKILSGRDLFFPSRSIYLSHFAFRASHPNEAGFAKMQRCNLIRQAQNQHKPHSPSKEERLPSPLIFESSSCADKKVILDNALAELYGVSGKRLNEQIKRNPKRFPPDFVFELTPREYKSLRSQFATSNILCPTPSRSMALSWPPTYSTLNKRSK